jgi:hypothetical protein
MNKKQKKFQDASKYDICPGHATQHYYCVPCVLNTDKIRDVG